MAGAAPSVWGPAHGSGGASLHCPPAGCTLGPQGGSGRCIPLHGDTKGCYYPLSRVCQAISPSRPVTFVEPVAAPREATCVPVPQILPSLVLV